MTLSRDATREDLLPAGILLSQEEIQRALQGAGDGGAPLGDILQALRSWSESVGYFEHLRQENVYFSFPDAAFGVELRLQVNYSRMGYSLPTGERPSCPLCIGNIGTPGKEKLRVHQFTLGGRDYFAHLTPFPLHGGHFVVNRLEHIPMIIDRDALADASEFIGRCPGWLAASNSDVEWAGASVLQHHHLQVFQSLRLPLQDASPIRGRNMGEGARVSELRWPCPALRIEGATADALRVAGDLLLAWKRVRPGETTCNFLLHHGEKGEATVHLLLRHPRFRTGKDLRAIKSEGVGIIEMAGEVIVPPREGLSRAENTVYFKEIGAALIPRLIADNSPAGDFVTRYLEDVFPP